LDQSGNLRLGVLRGIFGELPPNQARAISNLLAHGQFAHQVAGVGWNHRTLGYECYHSRNLTDLRGAKSNVMSSLVSHRNRNCLLLPL